MVLINMSLWAVAMILIPCDLKKDAELHSHLTATSVKFIY